MAAAGNVETIISGVRREEREELVRVVEYSGFPRTAPEPELQIGFTRDLSLSGMCIGVDHREEIGALLRMSVRDVEGRPAAARVGRVVWASSDRDGRTWLGIELITPASTSRTVTSIGRAAAGNLLRLPEA